MKHHIFLLTLVSLSFSTPFSLFSQHKISLKGNIANLDSINEVVLLNAANNSQLTSAELKSNGKFSLEPKIEGADFYKLYFTEEVSYILVLEGNEKITLQLDANNPLEPVIEGTPHTDFFYKTLLELQKFDRRLDSLQQGFSQVMNLSNDSTVEDFETKKNMLLEMLRSEYQQTQANKETYVATTVEKNSSSLVALLLVEMLNIQHYFETYKKVDEALYQRFPENKLVGKFHNRIREESRLSVGATAPNIELPTPEGESVSLSSLRGQVVMIDFWASWCRPCRMENPNVVRLYDKYHEKGFEIFGVSLDSNMDAWKKAIYSDQLSWIHVSDLKGWDSSAGQLYKVKGIPFTVLLDKEGKIIAKNLRGESLENKLAELFK